MVKRFIAASAFILGCIGNAWASTPATLTNLRAIHALSNEEANQLLPVDFEATVTYYNRLATELFVQDGDCAVFVYITKSLKLTPGDRVRVRGAMGASFRPIVTSDDVTVLGHGDLPPSKTATYNELIHNSLDGRLVTVRAVVRAADLIVSKHAPSLYLQTLADEGAIDVSVQSDDGSAMKDLLGAEVEVTGVVAAKFDTKMQQTDIILHASSVADVRVLKRARVNPWTLKATPMDEIFGRYRIRDLTERLRVHGVITYYQPGTAVVLQDGGKSLWVATRTSEHLAVGDVADATGFPDVHDEFLSIVRGEIHDSHVQAPVTPLMADWVTLSLSNNRLTGHIYDLVSIEATVVQQTRAGAQDEYVLNTQGHVFSAIYRHSDRVSLIPLPPMKQIPLGSKVRVTGICLQMWSSPWNGEIPFTILLRSFDDVTLVANPSPLNIRNLILVVGLLLVVLVAAGAWGWALERKVRRQTTDMATRVESEAALERRMTQLEQQRSRILEDINGSKPLSEILERIAAMVSFELQGAPCWFETNGANLGNIPLDTSELRIVSETVRGRSEPMLGTMFAALSPLTQTSANESEALSIGTRLAALAIETRRLYSNLLHRCEFDLLTDIANRFSLEKRLGAVMQESRETNAIFGLIYIDLDKFKQVNDICGHHVGDLYLQEASQRMKRQLRTVDLLARIGGDEFAALVPQVRSRADVEEIAVRLERCFDPPFAVDGRVLHFAASIGVALYPDDAVTQAGLLSAADAAMYKVKNSRSFPVRGGAPDRLQIH